MLGFLARKHCEPQCEQRDLVEDVVSESEVGPTDPVREALAVLSAGGMVVVADERDREDEADLIMAAAEVTPERMAFFLRHGSGIVCAPMTDERANALGLPLMVEENTESHGTAFTVTVDHVGVGTGISATDRAATVRALADPATTPDDLARPGHVFPLRARAGGVLKRAGHTEAATDLLSLAGVGDVGVITELVDDSGVPLTGVASRAFAAAHDLPFLHVEDLVRARRRDTTLVTRTGSAELPLAAARFTAHAYTSVLDGVDHLALTLGDVGLASQNPGGALVRVHSECLTGDMLGSQRCDCGHQLHQAIDLIAAEGTGAIVYLRGHEGRGIGLGHKMRAYALQDDGHDTVDANSALGLPVDSREYGVGAAILADLGVRRMRLITNNPHKYVGLAGFDLDIVARVRTSVGVTADNLAYLRTKRDRMGHDLELPAELSVERRHGVG
jgi:3,4-dihydroxy 2-butanone 4-phosphate synthase/GTP cyclohydrolase II